MTGSQRSRSRRERSSPYTPTPTRRSPRLKPPSSTSSHSRTTRLSQSAQPPSRDSSSPVTIRRSPRLATPPVVSSSVTTGAFPHTDPVAPDVMQAHPTPSPSPVVQAQSAQRTDTEALAAATDPRRHQLIVRPIVRTTFSQREQSGEQLDDVALNGSTFKDILKKIWERFSPRVKGQAVKQDGAWAVEVPTIEAWSKVMAFKANRHLISNTKTDLAWDRWLTSTQGETVLLLVYEFGVAIGKDSDLKEFKDACITPTSTDRSGATAELRLQDVVSRLQLTGKAPSNVQQRFGGCEETTLPGI